MEVEAEKINPYHGDNRAKTEQVRDMFDSIAPAYDFMNRAMTFGIDRRWRSIAVSMISRNKPKKILDIATGTADLAIELAQKLQPEKIVGADLSEGMISIGRQKVEKAGLSDCIDLCVADSLALPFENDSFDCITVAYGVRNFEHLLQGYHEMYRVLKPGGMLCVVELSTPTSAFIKPFYKFYTRTLIPAIGRIISKDTRAYSYLPESIAAVPQGENMLALMREAGFCETAHRPLTFGVCSIYTAKKTL